MKRKLHFCCTLVLAVGLAAQPGRAQGKPEVAKAPAYPLAARAAGIEGAVVLEATITKLGDVKDVRVISGPPELRQAAVDAVISWKYKPQHHWGRAVDVDTTITVNFKMGAGDKKKAEQAKAQAELAGGSPLQTN